MRVDSPGERRAVSSGEWQALWPNHGGNNCDNLNPLLTETDWSTAPLASLPPVNLASATTMTMTNGFTRLICPRAPWPLFEAKVANAEQQPLLPDT